MTGEQFRDRLRRDFLSHWQNHDPAPQALLGWEGKPIDTGDPRAKEHGFVRFSVQHFDGNQASLGNHHFRRTGQIYIQCFELEDRGAKLTEVLADIAVEFLERGVDYARITTPGILDAGPDGLGWYQRQANASFSYDRTL